MKKCLCSFLIVIILINFIFLNSSYAEDPDEENSETYTMQDFEQASENSDANINGEQKSIAPIGDSSVATPLGFIISFVNVPVLLIQTLASMFITSVGTIDSNISEDDYALFNIKNIITGKYVLFDADVFNDLTKPETDGGAGLSKENVMVKLRKNISMWFIILRDMAIVINLCMLVYIAVRMSIATISSEKAKYKEMIYNWVISMVLLFALPYIMNLINIFTEIIVDFVRDIMDSMAEDSFETIIMKQLLLNFITANGLKAVFYTIIYWILLWNEMKFFFRYIKRTLTSFFLVIISPLITVTYAVDKIADKQAQAFSNWLHEYMINMFIQPIHCFTYLVFMYMANNIAITAPLVGVIFLMSLSKAEKIIISLLGISGISLKQVGDEFSMKGLTGKLRGLVPKPGPKPGSH